MTVALCRAPPCRRKRQTPAAAVASLAPLGEAGGTTEL
jgi:hypothetical protein